MKKRWFLLFLLVILLFTITNVSAQSCKNICDEDVLVKRISFFGFCLVTDKLDCSSCGCSCGDYNRDESSFCDDGKDNDCNGLIDGADSACKSLVIEQAQCSEDGLCKPNCIYGDPDCLCREQNGFLCGKSEECENPILAKEAGLCCSSVCIKESTCGFDGLCKTNCVNGDPDCSCDKQSGFLCDKGESCSKVIASSDINVCCGERCQSCNEDWKCSAWSICKDGKQTRECIDNNQCGTQLNKPLTSQSCGGECREAWICEEFSECSGGERTRICKDINNCGTVLKKPPLTEICSKSCSELRGFKCVSNQICEGNLLISSDKTCCSIACSEYDCVEDWVCPDWETISCPNTGIRSRTCIDKNDCKIQGRKTYDNVPQLTQECAYIDTCDNKIKDQGESDIDCGGICGSTCISGKTCIDNNDCIGDCINGKCFCEEDWDCSEWSECPIHGIQTKTCNDKNKCGTTNNRPNITQECDYTTPEETKTDEKEIAKEAKVEEKETEQTVFKSVIDNRPGIKTLKLEPKYNQNLILIFLVLTLIILVVFLKGKSKPTVFLTLFFTIMIIIGLLLYLNTRFEGTNAVPLIFVLPLLYVLALSFVYYSYKMKKTFILVFLNTHPVLKRLLFTEVYDVPDINQLRNYIANYLSKDQPVSHIKDKLYNTGWPKSLVDKAFQNISLIGNKTSNLSDVLVSIMRLSTTEENMMINALLEKDGLTENKIINKLDFTKSQMASVLSNLKRRDIIEIKGSKIYLNKILKG